MVFKLDISEVKAHADLLKKLHRSAFPVAIRGTLTDLAANVKLNTMPKSAEKYFKKRQKNFLTANSKFIPAKGFDVNSMFSEVGFYENKLAHQATNFAVKDLEEQEHGGIIEKKSLIPMSTARVSNNPGRVVRANARIKSLRNKKVIRTSAKGINGKTGKPIKVESKKQRFIRAAFMAKKLNGGDAYVLGNRNANGSRTLSLITRIMKTKKGVLRMKRTPLYNVLKGRSVKVKPTNFMKRASMESGHEAGKFFIKQAQRQFKKHGVSL